MLPRKGPQVSGILERANRTRVEAFYEVYNCNCVVGAPGQMSVKVLLTR